MGRLFGTDGARGVAITELTCELAMQIGRAAALVLTKETKHRAKIFIGKDTRMSSDILEAALCAGICSVGAQAVKLGVVPTPAVAYLVRTKGADAGVMMIELQSHTNVGTIAEYTNAKEDYIAYLADCVHTDCTGMRMALDCANGSASATAQSLFTRLGAQVHMLSAQPDGTNINLNCGSTHMEQLMEYVKTHDCDLGLAFDGDADRCLAVDENGVLVDGDKIIAICAQAMQKAGSLKGDTAVVTVMTNLGFFHFAKANHIATKATKVGDRYVLEEMLSGGYNIGGEQSGHIIFLDEATTGDGELSGIKLMEILKRSGKKMSELAGLMETFPQVLYNVTIPAEKKGHWQEDTAIAALIDQYTQELGDNGRILVRESGTEPLVRVMVEGKDAQQIETAAQAITAQVKVFAGA